MIDPAGFNKTVILTGCSSGIGLATTLLFLSHQYRVFGIDITPFDYTILDSLDGGLYQEHFHFHQADLTKENAVRESVAIAVEAFGPHIDVLANIAGVMDSFSAADTVTDAEWDKVMGVNLIAPVKLMREVLPFMKEKKHGVIVNVCSKASFSGATAGLAYTCSKHGLLGATRHTAWRFKDEGIRCNAILPGAVQTNISHGMGPETMDMAAYMTLAAIQAAHTNNTTPVIQTKDIANAILFLASDAASMINGVALPVDRAWGVI